MSSVLPTLIYTLNTTQIKILADSFVAMDIWKYKGPRITKFTKEKKVKWQIVFNFKTFYKKGMEMNMCHESTFYRRPMRGILYKSLFLHTVT